MQLVVQYVTQASIKQCFRVPVITRAAAFNTRCNLSVTVLVALARTMLQ